MVTSAVVEYQPELDDRYDDFEFDAYDEDEFFKWLDKVRKSRGWRNVGKAAVTGAGGLAGLGLSHWLGKKPSPYAGVAGSALGGMVGNWIFDPFEDDYGWGETYELEDGESDEAIVAQMEHLGYLASETESDAEADAFIGALIPLAAKLIPRAASVVRRVAPTLIRGATRVVRKLRRSPATRRLVRAMPTIVRQTTRQVARQMRRGRPPTPRRARRTLMRRTGRVLRSPAATTSALRRCAMMNRRLMMANRALSAQLRRARMRRLR